MLAPDFLAGTPPFDVVFCRNLLIYLHADARRTVLSAVRRLLAPDGVLVVRSRGERVIVRAHGFAALRHAGAFASLHTRRTPQVTAEGADQRRSLARSPSACDSGAGQKGHRWRGLPRSVASSSRVNLPRRPKTLRFSPGNNRSMRRPIRACLRGLGAMPMRVTLALPRLARALNYLHTVPDSADGHFLMGVLHCGRGPAAAGVRRVLHARAVSSTRRTLGSLGHLALKHEARGDSAAAPARLRAP